MILNPLTTEYLEFIKNNKPTVQEREYIINHIKFKREAVRESVQRENNIGKCASPIQIDQMKGFVEDLDFMKQGLKGHWAAMSNFFRL